MSFTINRTYVLSPGKNYDPGSNGNMPYSFTGNLTAGSTLVTISGPGANKAIDRIIDINGSAVIEGGPFSSRIPVGVTSGTGITGTQLVLGITATHSGAFSFRTFDGDIPNTTDSPVLAIHVLADPGAVDAITLSGCPIAFPSGSLSAKGVYDYGISSIVSLGTTGALLGLAPAIKPYII
jgi:hypothetical protein